MFFWNKNKKAVFCLGLLGQEHGRFHLKTLYFSPISLGGCGISMQHGLTRQAGQLRLLTLIRFYPINLCDASVPTPHLDLCKFSCFQLRPDDLILSCRSASQRGGGFAHVVNGRVASNSHFRVSSLKEPLSSSQIRA